MKATIFILLFVSLISCQKGPLVPSENPVAANCKTIRIVEDGEETVLEFTPDGRLSKYADQLIHTNEKNSDFAITFRYNDATHSISHRNKIWSLSILDNDKNGFEQGWLDNFGKGKLIFSIWEGLENGIVISREETDFKYDNKGNAVSYNSTFTLDNATIFKKTGTISYSSKVSPFAMHPFQFLIELHWTPAAHNNNNLASEELYTISNEGLDDTHFVLIEGTVTYQYSWDSSNRLNQISIETTERKTVRNKTTLTTTKETNTQKKVIQIQYQC